MKSLTKIFAVLTIFVFVTSCSSVSKTLREPNVRVELERNDFELSPQVSAEASTTRILSIDWNRLFKKEQASVEGWSSSFINTANIPVIGSPIPGLDRTQNYALYNLMVANPGYDVVFYPQYETRVSKPFLGIGFIYSKTEVKATARLGKMK
ncbi:MAG: hypothetical protein RL264_2264 [Bacteroidota bacterium]|jgi:hypothetical protein